MSPSLCITQAPLARLFHCLQTFIWASLETFTLTNTKMLETLRDCLVAIQQNQAVVLQLTRPPLALPHPPLALPCLPLALHRPPPALVPRQPGVST